MAITFLGLIFGDDGTGYAVPTYADLRSALGTYWRKLRNLPSLNLSPGAFFGDMLDIFTSVVHAGAQAGADAAAKAIFTSAAGTSLDQLLYPVTIRLPATSSTAEVYVYGAVGAAVPISSTVRTSPTAPAFLFDAGVVVPPAAAAEAWVWEVEDFAAGGASGVQFDLTVDGNLFTVVAGPGDDSEDIRDALVSAVNAAALTQAAYQAGTLPNADPTRWAGLVREESGAGPFPVLFTSTGGPSLTSVYTADFDTVTASDTGAIEAAAQALRYGQGFAGVVGYVNVEAAAPGRDIETDSQMKARHLLTQRQGAGNPDAIRSAVLTPVEFGGAGATYCSVEYNSTNAVDAFGNAPHSVRVVVDTTVSLAAVAAVVWTLKAAGDNTNGAFAILTPDAEGNSQVIQLDRLETLYIWCDIEVTIGPGWPITGNPIQQLREDVTAFIVALGGGKSVKPNDAPVSVFPNGSPRGVSNFRIRFGSSTDPAGLVPPIAYLDYWPDPEPDASLATVAITGRQVADTSLARVSAVIV